MPEPAITYPLILVFIGALVAALAGLPIVRPRLKAPQLGLLLSLAPLCAFVLLLTIVPPSRPTWSIPGSFTGSRQQN